MPTARPWGSAFLGQRGALQLAADPPQTERTSLSEMPSAWAPWHPVAQTLCFRCRGRRFNPAGEDPTGHVARPEKVKKKKKKKERKRNACCLHNPSQSMHQPAPSPRNMVGAVGAHQTWSFPQGRHPVKLPLTVPQKSGAVEQRGPPLVLQLQVTRCDPVPTKWGEEAVQTSFWGAVGSETNGRRLPPSILTRALWGGSQARGPTGRPAFRHFPGRAGGASIPGLFCCNGTQEGLGRRGAAKAGRGQAGGAQSCHCRAPLPCAGGRC